MVFNFNSFNSRLFKLFIGLGLIFRGVFVSGFENGMPCAYILGGTGLFFLISSLSGFCPAAVLLGQNK